ncbi:MAG: hypothetical protein WBM04_00055, partial [Candidatus Korobacteraceae bacterium]
PFTARLKRLLKKYFLGSFRTRTGLQVLETSFAEMIKITELVHFSATSEAVPPLQGTQAQGEKRS